MSVSLAAAGEYLRVSDLRFAVCAVPLCAFVRHTTVLSERERFMHRADVALTSGLDVDPGPVTRPVPPPTPFRCRRTGESPDLGSVFPLGPRPAAQSSSADAETRTAL